MKKIYQKIKLRKFKNEINKKCLEKSKRIKGYYVLFNDSTFEFASDKADLLKLIRIDQAIAVFDILDKICIDRDIIIDEKEVK